MPGESDMAGEQMSGGNRVAPGGVNQPVVPAPPTPKPVASRPLAAAAKWGAIGVLGLIAVVAVVWVILTNRTRPAIMPVVAAPVSPQTVGLSSAGGSLLDVNTASAAQLEHLPGIGPALAARIVADREKHGRYTSLDQLDRVQGIGKKTLEKLRPHITVK